MALQNALLHQEDDEYSTKISKAVTLSSANDGIAELARRWLLAVLNVTGEGLDDLRFRAGPNAAHLEQLRRVSARAARSVGLWCGTPEAGDRDLPGTTDSETLFMMGEELHSCMRIDKQCINENRGLLGYLLQGNVRLLLVRGPSGRTLARAAVRLLARDDNGEPVIWLDQPLYQPYEGLALGKASEQAELESELLQQAKLLSQCLDVPLVLWKNSVAPRPTEDPVTCPGAHPGMVQAQTLTRATGAELSRTSWIELFEHSGLAPFVYSNLRGLVKRSPGGRIVYALTRVTSIENPDPCKFSDSCTLAGATANN